MYLPLLSIRDLTLPRTDCSFLALLRYASVCTCGERCGLMNREALADIKKRFSLDTTYLDGAAKKPPRQQNVSLFS